MKITMTDFGVLEFHDRTINKLQNLGPAMDEIAGELLAILDESFINLADPTTRSSWPPLADSTMIERALLGYSASEVLQRSGSLKRSVQTQTGSDFVEVGSSIEYALTHQFGGEAHGAIIPARPYVGAHQEDLASFEQIIRDHILRR